ncbi:MAG TPA: UPF0182 family protein [Leptospiraceae bacterium]|nr:hypothetical protein [Spirochaetaceae bacterium]HBS03350.1 UPF0182 family protein [Leptospiraceae bacterium]|tara:strand:- start:13299 stop:16046 length:2748 start_codon:yes stop_codon:yes gene_type:complete
MEKLKKFTLPLALGAGLLIILSFSTISNQYLDLQWFKSQKLGGLYFTYLWLNLLPFIGGFALSLLFYLPVYKFNTKSLRLLFSEGMFTKGWNYLFAAIPFGAAFLFHGPSAVTLSDSIPLFFYGSDAGIVDPVLGVDVSFYMFDLPFYKGIIHYFEILIIALAVYSAAMFYLPVQAAGISGKLHYKDALIFRITVLGSILGTLFLSVLAIDFWLDSYELITSGTSSTVAGAAYTDANFTLYGYRVLAVVAGLAALVTLFALFRKSYKTAAIAVVSVFVLYLVGIRLVPFLIQSLQVNPNEFAMEQEYIEHSISYTRKGYGLDQVKRSNFEPGQGIDPQTVQRNQELISNIRLWDYRPLRATFRQLQEIRPYYEFADVDVDRYRINGQLRQVMLSARELNASELSSHVQKNWIPMKLQYTHGYGVVMSPTNRVTEDGLPELWIKNFPPEIKQEGLPEFKEPRIYFGEIQENYVVVNTGINEIDYPAGQEFQETRYAGEGGIALGSGLHRLLISWPFDTYKLLMSEYIKDDSRLLIRRNIHEAVRRLAPFLEFDEDAYPVVGKDGKLYWILDAYTVSQRFPYSARINPEFLASMSNRLNLRRFGGINYIRNSVKVVIDAYSGKVRMFSIDEKDPVLAAYKKFLPDLIQPMSEFPEFLKAHLRYPEAIFMIQASIYTDYHMEDPQVFYNREDRWEISQELYDSNKQMVEPYYAIVKLPGEQEPETVIMLPFIPKNKQNLVSWMGVRCDADRGLGEILVFDFPRSRQIYGPMQIEARIDQDAEISPQISLWDQQGSSVIRGNLLVLPIENELVYVEPLYLQSNESPFPELKRVIVASGTSIAMRNTLQEAIEAVARNRTGTSEPGAENAPSTAVDPKQLVRQAKEALRQARSAAGRGDWKQFGEFMNELENTLNRIPSN